MASNVLAAVAIVVLVAVAGCASTVRNDYQLTSEAVVGRMSLAFTDETRPRWVGGSGARPISLMVWYPADDRVAEADWGLGPPGKMAMRFGRSAENAAPLEPPPKRPLIVLSHGTGGSAPLLAWLAEPLVRAGFIVAAITHHGNNPAELKAEGFALWWERATDVSRTLDYLLSDDRFRARIDPSRIGAAGFSLGGYTVLEVAGAKTSLAAFTAFCESAARDATCEPPPEFPKLLVMFDQIRDRPDVAESLRRHGESFRDSRIRAVMAMAPVGSPLTTESLREISTPVRLIVGDRDQVTPPATQAERLANEIPRARLTILPGVGHLTFAPECTPAGAARAPQLCQDGEGVDRASVHEKVAREAVGFFHEELGR